MAMISLEDLEGLDDDEQLDDDITDNNEPMDQDDRLLSHWRAVASTHQVSVPPVLEMTGPIHEMTQNSQQREPLPFSAVSRHEKLGEVLYEERVYPAGNWACVTTGEHLYEQSISMGFMKLMRFICKENSVGICDSLSMTLPPVSMTPPPVSMTPPPVSQLKTKLSRYLGMTVPIVTHIHLMEDKNTFEKNVETAFFLPVQFQTAPPCPSDSDIRIVHREPIRVVARTFFGTTTEETVGQQVRLLWEVLDGTDDLHRDNFMVAVYENPGVPRRRNEIWFIRRF